MERVVAENGVVYYRSPLIPCPHGFSTRVGGISELPHTASLNLGVERGDSKDTVLENLRSFGEAVGIEPRQIISVPQIHSNIVTEVFSHNAGEGFYKEPSGKYDGYITTDRDIAIGVRTADCVPILMYAPENGAFKGAVMAVHAGWRGTASGIATEAVRKAIALGADISTVRVAIGPAIESCCYEVKEDFYTAFLNAAGKDICEKYVTPKTEHTWQADLKGANREMLIECGIAEENIDVSDACTCCRHEEFYSHRYTGGKRGTMLSVILLRG